MGVGGCGRKGMEEDTANATAGSHQGSLVTLAARVCYMGLIVETCATAAACGFSGFPDAEQPRGPVRTYRHCATMSLYATCAWLKEQSSIRPNRSESYTLPTHTLTVHLHHGSREGKTALTPAFSGRQIILLCPNS